MSKQSPIKWRKSDEKELARLVRNFNNKVRRIEEKAKAEEKRIFKETGQKVGIVVPERISLVDLKKGRTYTDDLGNEIIIDPLIKTRQDLKREMNRLKRFTTRGSDELVSVPNYNNLLMTKWQRKEMSNMQRQINQDRNKTKKKLAELEAKSGGSGLGYSVLQAHEQIGTGTISSNSYNPISAFPEPWSSKKEELGFLKTSLNKRFKSFQRQVTTKFYDERAMRLKENYIEAIKTGYGLSDHDIEVLRSANEVVTVEGRAVSVIDYLEQMDIEQFMDIFYAEGDRVTFDWAYANETDDRVTIAGQTPDSLVGMLERVWKK